MALVEVRAMVPLLVKPFAAVSVVPADVACTVTVPFCTNAVLMFELP